MFYSCYSKSDLRTSNNDIVWELDRITDSQVYSGPTESDLLSNKTIRVLEFVECCSILSLNLQCELDPQSYC